MTKKDDIIPLEPCDNCKKAGETEHCGNDWCHINKGEKDDDNENNDDN